MGLRVLFVDDHDGFRAAARGLMEAGGLEVVGEAADIASAVDAARALRPDLVLLDVRLPDGDGIEAARALSNGEGNPAVVLVSSRPGSDYGSRIDESGARGFIPKAELTVAGVTRLVEGGP